MAHDGINYLYLKVSTKYKKIIHLIQRFADYIKVSLRYAKNPLSLEFFEEGFIIYGLDIKNFVENYGERTKFFSQIDKNKINLQENVFFSRFELEDSFPAEGMIFMLEISLPAAPTFLKILQENYSYIHPNIEFLPKNAQSFLINFRNVDSLMAYAAYIQLYAENIAKKIKKIN